MPNGKSAAEAVWGASPAGSTYGRSASPGTEEFFASVLRTRTAYEMPWLFDRVPFRSYQGKSALEVGCGAGYNAYAFCRTGADYVGIDLVAAIPFGSGSSSARSVTSSR